ncbi:MAG: hypothetical protein HUK18_01770 [Bacteroidales bacterium]|nr:hypothetical protein [Bacteroidales bacterium]
MKIQVKETTTLLNFVQSIFPEVSVTKAKKMIMYNCFSIAGASIKSFEYILHKGDTIDYQKYSGGKHIAREKRDVLVLYEDADVLVANKAAGVAVYDPKNKKSEDLLSEIKRYVHKKDHKAIINVIFAPDVYESGLCLFAKNKYAFDVLTKEKHTFGFEIDAMVCRPLKHKNDKIKFYYRNNKNRWEISRSPKDGFEETTLQYKTIEDFSQGEENFYHILISQKGYKPFLTRALLKELGNPVIGDLRFDRQKSKNILKFCYSSISFQRTDNGRKAQIDCKVPKQFTAFNYPLYDAEEKKDDKE